jgi:hypothetical protein
VKATRQIARFDSAPAMLQALAASLRGRPFPRIGSPPGMGLVASGVNLLADGLREQAYIWSGWNEALPPERLGDVRGDAVTGWAAGMYPEGPYPAVAIGSSSGAATHLWAALGIPWLPQTFLVPVRRSLPPDEAEDDLAFGRRWGPVLLDANPDLALHHMHDANQDRLMIRRMTYFRVKRRRLGDLYRRFLERNLAPDGTLFVVDCSLRWPTVRVSDRHVFQPGALGGAEPDEYVRGGARVEDLLRRYRSPRRRWPYPEPDGESPESEWGFEPALLRDLEALAAQRDWRLRRVSFERPEDLSPLVADVIRWWYRSRGLPDDRLVVPSFLLLDPWSTFRAGAVPFWTTFAVEPSAAALEGYLGGSAPFRDVRVTLFSHGVESIGLAGPARWAGIARAAGARGGFLGVDPSRFPRDFAVFGRFDHALGRLAGPHGVPDRLSLDDLDRFLEEQGPRYAVRWVPARDRSA